MKKDDGQGLYRYYWSALQLIGISESTIRYGWFYSS